MGYEDRYSKKIDTRDQNSSHMQALRMVEKGKRILEFGPASGAVTHYLKESLGCSVWGVELDEKYAKSASRYAEEILVGDAEELGWKKSFGRRRFDHILMLDFLEHLREPLKVLQEAKGLLARGGSIIISVPNIAHNSIIMQLLEDKFHYSKNGLLDQTHVYHFTQNSLLEMITRAGLFLAELKGVTRKPEETEFGVGLGLLDDNGQALLGARPYGDIYQFVCKVEAEVVAPRLVNIDLPRKDMTIGVASLYWDQGEGYSEKNKTEVNLCEGPNTIIHSLKEGALSVKLTFGDRYCVAEMQEAKAIMPNKRIDYVKMVQNNAILSEGGVFLFANPEPSIIYEIPSSCREISFDFKYKVTGEKVAIHLLSAMEKKYEVDLTTSQKEIDSAKNQCIECNAKIEMFKSDMVFIRGEKKEIERELTDCNIRKQLWKTRYEELESAHKESNSTINNYERSLSWRITKPLRLAYDLLHLPFQKNEKEKSPLQSSHLYQSILDIALQKDKMRELLRRFRFSSVGTALYSRIPANIKQEINTKWAGGTYLPEMSIKLKPEYPPCEIAGCPLQKRKGDGERALLKARIKKGVDGADLVWMKITENLTQEGFVISISHDDYFRHVGGVQAHMLDEQAAFNENGSNYVNIHPLIPLEGLAPEGCSVPLRASVDGKLVGTFSSEELGALGESLLAYDAKPCAGIVIHHTLSWDIEGLAEFLRKANLQTLFWIHDFFSACPQYNLMRNGSKFCGNPPIESNACLICGFGESRKRDTQRFEAFFNEFDLKFVTPSEFALKIWGKTYSKHLEQVHVVPHMKMLKKDLAPTSREENVARCDYRIKVAFVGLPVEKKGWSSWRNLVDNQNEVSAQYAFYHLGNKSEKNKEKFRKVNVSHNDRHAMVKTLRKESIDVAFLWSVCPETYSFALHEALAAGCMIITHADSGNIARQVLKNGYGKCFETDQEMIEYLADRTKVVSDLLGFWKRCPSLYDLGVNIQTPALLSK